MQLFGIDLETRPALIAEIGVNHEGDVDKAVALLNLAADAGADAVKFQSYTPARYIAAQDAERLARVTSFALNQEAHLRLKAEAAVRGVAFFSSALSEDWVPFLAEHGAAVKIASGDIDFEPVVRAAAASGRPVLLSTGTARLSEIRQAVAWAEAEIGTAHLAERLLVMHCVSAYPTPMEEANLAAIPSLAAAFAPIPIGYSNHVLGVEAPMAAVALGARAVEVHFTDCKEGRSFRDHALSCDADDLAYLARVLPGIAAAVRGDGEKRPQACEAGVTTAIRKGVIAATDLPVGRSLEPADLAYARPADGFPAAHRDSLIGRRLVRPVAAGHALHPADLAE